jgi:hypothetical protein
LTVRAHRFIVGLRVRPTSNGGKQVVFIWHGWGIAILAIPVVLAIATEYALDSIYGPGAFTEGLRLY